MNPTCERCGERNAQTYHRVAMGIGWLVYVCGTCFEAIRAASPPVRRACPVHHSTSCGCPALSDPPATTGGTS